MLRVCFVFNSGKWDRQDFSFFLFSPFLSWLDLTWEFPWILELEIVVDLDFEIGKDKRLSLCCICRICTAIYSFILYIDVWSYRTVESEEFFFFREIESRMRTDCLRGIHFLLSMVCPRSSMYMEYVCIVDASYFSVRNK